MKWHFKNNNFAEGSNIICINEAKKIIDSIAPMIVFKELVRIDGNEESNLSEANLVFMTIATLEGILAKFDDDTVKAAKKTVQRVLMKDFDSASEDEPSDTLVSATIDADTIGDLKDALDCIRDAMKED